MGQPTVSTVSLSEYIGQRGEPGELKHLSTRRKGHQPRTPLVVASERGPGQCFGEDNWNHQERWALEGDSPVQVIPNQSHE